ncbi:MAG: hypothetical protein EBW87_00075 [Burkholderiaceae bacterium]|nr:hypothetical protein [Burkholderiaceae bacterium]
MAKYKIITLTVQGLGKKIFELGDVVTESDLIESEIPRLIKGEYIEQITDEENSNSVEADLDEDASSDDSKEEQEEKLTKQKIVELLTNAGVPFDASTKKAALRELAESLGLI